MPLVGINPVQNQQKEGSLAKVAAAVSIANNVLGTAMEIPKYMMAKEQQKEQSQLNKANMRSKLVSDYHAPTKDEMDQGVKGQIFEGFEDLGPLAPNKVDEMTKALSLKDVDSIRNKYDYASHGDQGAVEFILPTGHKIYGTLKKNVDPAYVSGETALRKEYEQQAEKFVIAKNAFRRVLASDNSWAGNMALAKNYALVFAPESVRSGVDPEQLHATGGLPDVADEGFRKILGQMDETGKINPTVFASLKKQARDYIDSQEQDQKDIEKRYRGLAVDYDYKPENVVTPFSEFLEKLKAQTPNWDAYFTPKAKKKKTMVVNGEEYESTD